jgi:hypothetical protein
LIERNSIGNPGGDGIRLTNLAGSEIQISDNTILSDVDDGISLDGTAVAATIQNNTIEDGAVNGIRLTGGDVAATVNGNTANRTTANGLLVEATTFTGTVTDNVFEMGQGSGISLDLMTEFRGAIDNNMVRTNEAEGIFLNSSVITNTNVMSNATISGNDASDSATGISLMSMNPLIDITGNTADNTGLVGLLLSTNTYPGTISNNQFNSGSGSGIDLTTTLAFTGTVSGNTTNNTGGSGLRLNVLSMDGLISGNTSNMNSSDGIVVTVQQTEPATGFSGTIDTNNTDFNGANGLNLIGLTSTFEGALRSNTAMSNMLSGIRYDGTGGVFESNIESNTASSNGSQGLEILSQKFNGSLLQNDFQSNSIEGVNMMISGPSHSLIDLIGNVVSGNNINAMVTGSQFRLENTGTGDVIVVLDGNTSTDTVMMPAFNFNLLRTGSGSVMATIVPPSAATGTVGENGTQVFPFP